MKFHLPLVAAFFASFCLASVSVTVAEPATPSASPRSSVKLLTIGNSFARNSLEYLPQLAAASGKKLVVFPANLGGHSMQQHVGYLQAFEANPDDPKGRPYKKLPDPRTGEKKDFSLREALQSEDWDVVTIQQVSAQSYRPETFQPSAGILIDYIRKYAPHAEILINQTWAYPDDYFPKFNKPGLDQQKMYEGIKAAYGKLSRETGLRIIPVGDAFQIARALPNPPSLNIPGDKHANEAGCYLAGATYYEMIFGDSVEGSTFVPKGVSPEDALRLRHAAHEAVLHAEQPDSAAKAP